MACSTRTRRPDADGTPLKVVHCDISPGNIVVSWGGTVKIVDFGIARATIQLRAEDHTVAGKYNYMAPEQIRGEPVDARADIFSLGVILYELTVGKRLFRGRPEQVMRLVLEEPIASRARCGPISPRRSSRSSCRRSSVTATAATRLPATCANDLLGWLARGGARWRQAPGGRCTCARCSARKSAMTRTSSAPRATRTRSWSSKRDFPV